MPTATPFKALGKGNGFPYCPTVENKIDVNNYSKWTTLGEYNSNSSGAVTEYQINLSRQRAMQLYWNLYQVNCSLSSFNDIDSSGFNNIWDESITNVSTNTEPKNRTCSFSHFYEINRSDQPGEENEIYCGIAAYVSPLWLFKGSVTNWENFIGFSVGASSGFLAFIDSSAKQIKFTNSYTDSRVRLSCASNSGTLTNISGYPFVCEANGDDTDENNLTAESEETGTSVDGTVYTRTSSVSISSLSFYTY